MMRMASPLRSMLTGSSTLRISEVFDFTREDPTVGDTGEVIDETTPIDPGRETALRSTTSLNLNHRFTSRLSGNFSGRLSIFDSEASNRVNSQSFTGQGGLNYRIDGATTAGLGGAVTVQLFDEADTGNVAQSRSQTTVARVFGSLTRRFGETTTLSVEVGPAFIFTDQEPADHTRRDVTQVPFRQIEGAETREIGGEDVSGESVLVFARIFDDPDDDAPGRAVIFAEPTDPAFVDTGLFTQTRIFLPEGSLLLSDVRSCPVISGEEFVVINNSCGGQGMFLTSDPETTGGFDGDAFIPIFESDDPAQQPGLQALGMAQEQARLEVLNREAGQPGSIDLTQFAMGNEPEGISNSQFTIFANVRLTKRWSPNFATTLSYRRSESQASGLSASNIQDAVTLSGNWRPGDRWSFRGSVFYVQRESFSEVQRTLQQAGVIDLEEFNGVASEDLFLPGTQLGGRTGLLLSRTIDNAVDTTRWGMQVRAERQLTRNLIGDLRLFYNQQETTQGNPGVSQSFDDFTVILGLSYSFDPFHL